MIPKCTIVIISVFLFLIFIFIGCKNPPSTETCNISNKTIIKVSDFEVDVKKFNEHLENKKISCNSKNWYEIEKELLDYFLCFGILLAEAQKRGYNNDPEIERQITEHKKSLLINAAQKHEFDKQKISESELKAAYKRSKYKLIIDHVWLKSDSIAILDEMLNYLKGENSSIEQFLSLQGSISHELMASIDIERKILFGGSMINELEREAYKMKQGEIKVFKTERGYHIFNLVNRGHNFRGTFEKEKDNIHERLAKTKVEDQGIFQIDKKINNEIKIDSDILASMNFSVAPLIKQNRSVADNIIKDDETVAIIDGRKITVKELNSMIYQLSVYIKIYFNNHITRLNEIIKLLNTKYNNKISNNKCTLMNAYKEKLMIEDMLKIQLSDYKNNDNIHNLVEALTDWFGNLFDNWGELPIDSILIKEAYFKGLDNNYKINNTDIREDDKLYFFNCEELLNQINNLHIDFNVLNSMDFFNLYTKSCDEILAKKGKWIFKIDDLIKELKKLSQGSIKELRNIKNKYRFIECIENKNNYDSNDTEKLVINKILLEELDFDIIYKMIKLRPFEESDIVVSGDSISINVEQLRRKVCQLPKWKIKKFLIRVDSIDALKDLIVEEYWLNKANYLGLEKDMNIIKKINEKKQWLIVQKLYKNEIVKRNIMFADDRLDTLFYLAIREVSRQRLIKLLQRLSKNVEIKIDKLTFSNLGVSIDSTSFLQNISDQLFDRIGPDFELKINFQPDNVKVPFGYLKDSGALFGDRKNGYKYGWDKDISQNTRYRKDSKIDPILSTYNFFHKYGDRVWELKIPNGTYIVSFVAGDPVNDDHINNLSIEGTIVSDPDEMDNFDYYVVPVTVKDNRLTVKAFGAVKTRICFIEIKNYPNLQ